MAVEDCRYYQEGIIKFDKDKKLQEVECENPNCDLTIGLIKKKVGKRAASNDLQVGTPYPTGGRARCVEVEILSAKKNKILSKMNIHLASEEVINKLENERDLLKLEEEDFKTS